MYNKRIIVTIKSKKQNIMENLQTATFDHIMIFDHDADIPGPIDEPALTEIYSRPTNIQDTWNMAVKTNMDTGDGKTWQITTIFNDRYSINLVLKEKGQITNGTTFQYSVNMEREY